MRSVNEPNMLLTEQKDAFSYPSELGAGKDVLPFGVPSSGRPRRRLSKKAWEEGGGFKELASQARTGGEVSREGELNREEDALTKLNYCSGL